MHVQAVLLVLSCHIGSHQKNPTYLGQQMKLAQKRGTKHPLPGTDEEIKRKIFLHVNSPDRWWSAPQPRCSSSAQPTTHPCCLSLSCVSTYHFIWLKSESPGKNKGKIRFYGLLRGSTPAERTAIIFTTQITPHDVNRNLSFAVKYFTPSCIPSQDKKLPTFWHSLTSRKW